MFAGFFFNFLLALCVKGSVEDQIKQDLQAVAEGVAASVLHSATSSNPDMHDRNESEAIQDGDNQNSSVDMQRKAKAEVFFFLPAGWGGLFYLLVSFFLYLFFLFPCLFQDFKNKLLDKAHLVFPVSDGIGRLQVEILVLHFY